MKQKKQKRKKCGGDEGMMYRTSKQVRVQVLCENCTPSTKELCTVALELGT